MEGINTIFLKSKIFVRIHYEYKTNEKFDYCPECNAKLTNKCDSCNKYLPDSATNTCPYCGKEIEVKIGEIPPGNN